jgi:hypothetical protein
MARLRLLAVSSTLVLAAGLVAGVVGPASAAPARSGNGWSDWYAYHQSGHRAGYSAGMPSVHQLAVTHRITLDGAVYASPIVVGGVTIVATENDTVYAFSSTYRQLWKRHVGSPSPAAQRPCGNIDPLGITGTPSYAAKTGDVYVAAELGGSTPSHQLFAISVRTGRVSWHRTLDLPGVDPAAMQERGALLTGPKGVYVPFGGLAGDCGAYKGRVIRYSLTGSGSPASFTVPTQREAGIWTPPGPTSDGTAEYVAVGNGESGQGDAYDYSDSVLKLSVSALTRLDSFSPTTWPTDNDSDLDLGSQGPALVGNYVFSAGKSGTAYVLSRTHLGGIGGQVTTGKLCASFGGTAVVRSTVYVPCSDGVRAVNIGTHGKMHVLWHAGTAATGSPVVGLSA